MTTYTKTELENLYQVVGKLGKGAFGVVEIVKHRPTGVLFARKCHHLFAETKSRTWLFDLLNVFVRREEGDGSLEQAARRVDQEAANLSRFKGEPPILQLWEYYRTEDNTGHIVTELCAGGSILRLVAYRSETNPNKRFQKFEPTIQRILAGLATLHSKQVIHRDIKPNNILLRSVSSIEDVVLADFGLSKLLSNPKGITLSSYAAPPYTSAEQLLAFSSADERSDIYSTAIVLAELIAGRTVQQYLDKHHGASQLSQQELVELLVELDMQEVIQQLLMQFDNRRASSLITAVSRDPSLRPSISSIAQTLKL